MSATPKWVTIVMGAAVAATMLGACSATPAATPSPALTTAGSANPSNAAAHNEADTAFAQMMIVHHQGAIEMADLAAQQAQSADVQALAERISAAQGPEIETMSGWLSAWGEDPMPAESDMPGMDHSGMDMDGRSQEEVMAELRGLSGADFDRQFLTSMIAHHQGAIEMAQTQLADGRDPQAIELAQKIIADQEAEIEEMQGLLASA
ncbi:DUF305 domain-containing protein [Propioniciclava sinopodophylli]|uniref:DUF305 domain-containing protein n=1 Tax=Propioniciclava sinopodophylli TaxID=1837344 RepID=UPI002492E680|nr:DUF305 domain-containing protein [Propioniciclava sinopodophylli]